MRRGQDGFSVVELLVAILVLGFVALAAGAVLASGTRHASASETRQNLAHRAQQEAERLASLQYEAVAHPAAPASGASDPDNPLHWFDPAAGTYRWNRATGGSASAEELVVSAADGTVSTERTWTDGTASGRLWAFVTWVTDGRCGAGCPSSENYKRVTVAATIESGAEVTGAVYVSTIIADPNAVPAGRIVNGNPNPLVDPSITCVDPQGNTVPCTASVGSTSVNEWYLSDTPATSEYAAPTASHPTHPTVAPTGTCTTSSPAGCPVPDLLSTMTPPTPAPEAPLPPVLDYSTEQAALVHAGGRVLVRDVACSATPSSTDNTKGAFWVTAPLTQPTSLTGSGGMTLHTQTIAGVASGLTLCVGIYDVGNSLTNLIDDPPTRLGVVAYTVAEWPAAPTPVSFSFDFVTGGTIAVPAGHRIGARVWVDGASATDIALLYDHPSHTSVLQLNSQ